MNNVFVYPYRAGSNSARDLAQSMGVRRISRTNSRFRGNANKVVINWGATALPDSIDGSHVINTPDAVSRASDKLRFFQNAAEYDVPTPEWTQSKEEVYGWLQEGSRVVVRTVLNGHSGQGIIMLHPDSLEHMDDSDDIPDAPLYTRYVPKRNEYRIHVLNGQVISVQRKARLRDVPDDQVNWEIRNHANGFVFARDEAGLGEVPISVVQVSAQAVAALGLHFGAVDVVYNERRQQAYAIEVNTAPGLAGTTLEDYTNALTAYATEVV